MLYIKLLYRGIGLPDGRKAGSLRRHNVYADTVVHTQIVNAFPEEFHHFIVYIAVCKYGADNSKRNILRADALYRLPCQVYADYLRHIDIIRFI